MTAALFAGWVCTVWVLTAYVVMVRLGRPRIFHWANAVGCLGTGWAALSVGAWPNLALTLAFGVIGAWGLTRKEHS